MGTQNVTVVFATDDGRLATDVQLASSSPPLPAGWSSTANSLPCATVSSGAACQLTLAYNPLAAGAGTLMLNYSYVNNANQAKTGTLSIPYRATTNDTVVGTPSTSSLAVLTGSSTAVPVVFATDDGNPASSLSITSGFLPAGWSGPTSFSCATVSNGTPCQLPLTYAPTAVGSGTVSLGYTYTNDAGIVKPGTVNIAYRANSNDTVGAMLSPGAVAVPATTSQAVTVTFSTSDGAPATALSVSGLAAMPADWSGPGSFSCATVSNGTVCQLTLTYAPPAAESGNFQLTYSYTNNAGMAGQGTVTINYTSS